MTTTVTSIEALGYPDSGRLPENHVYIGRPSKWGNPFVIGEDGDREMVIGLYRTRLALYPELREQIGELKDKVLVCWCAPLPCHGDVLAELADGETP